MGRTVSPAVLCNEITMDGLQWLFISEQHSDFIRLREEERNTGRRRCGEEERDRERVLNLHTREMLCRKRGVARGKE